MNDHIFIQARMSSIRLPGKVLKKILNKSILELIYERVQKIKEVNEIFLVTGPSNKNELLIKEAKRLGLENYCGSENNILDRFLKASKEFSSENIIRVTADCPLIDFNLISDGLKIFDPKKFDILSNVRYRTYPHGFDFEIFSQKALEISWKDNLAKFSDIEEFSNIFISPTKYILEKKKFKNYDLKNNEDLSKFRLTLDYEEDFELIKKIFQGLYLKKKYFSMNDILNFLNEHKDLLNINQKHITDNQWLNIEK